MSSPHPAVEPPGQQTARLITFATIVVSPFSMLGVFADGGSRDCNLEPGHLICSAPGTWTAVTLGHVLVTLVLLAALVVGTRVRLRHGVAAFPWTLGWSGTVLLVLAITWWISTS